MEMHDPVVLLEGRALQRAGTVLSPDKLEASTHLVKMSRQSSLGIRNKNKYADYTLKDVAQAGFLHSCNTDALGTRS